MRFRSYIPYARPAPSLTGPAFEPWERFMLLERLLEEIPAERAHEVLHDVTRTAMTVVRQVYGSKSSTEAYAAIEQTRQRLEQIRLERLEELRRSA